MLGQDPQKITIQGKEYLCRFTVPRLREMSVRTGRSVGQLASACAGINFEAQCWLLWAAIAHPANPGGKDLTPAEVIDLVEPGQFQEIDAMLGKLIKDTWPAPDPPKP